MGGVGGVRCSRAKTVTTVRPGQRRRQAACSVLLLLAACGDGPTTLQRSNAEFIGTFRLTSLSGLDLIDSLPAVILQQNDYSLLVTDGELVVGADYTYRMRVNFRLTTNGSTFAPQWNAMGAYTVSSRFGQPLASFTDTGDRDNTFLGFPTAALAVGQQVPPTVVLNPNGQPFRIGLSFTR